MADIQVYIHEMKSRDVSRLLERESYENKIVPALVIDEVVEDVLSMIINTKNGLKTQINTSMTILYWSIGEYLSLNVLKDKKPEYGKNIIGEVIKKLSNQYRKGFERASVFRMIQFYEQFPSCEKVATLSQQLTWSHFIELEPFNHKKERISFRGDTFKRLIKSGKFQADGVIEYQLSIGINWFVRDNHKQYWRLPMKTK